MEAIERARTTQTPGQPVCGGGFSLCRGTHKYKDKLSHLQCMDDPKILKRMNVK